MSPGARQAAAMAGGWALAAGLVIGGIAYFQDIKGVAHSALGTGAPVPISEPRTSAPSGQRIVELQAGSLGHYHVDADMNGRTVHVLVDTGASIVALTYDDARAIGLHVSVMERGKLGTTLLGMSFLGRLQRVDMRAGVLVLQE
jgi:aspartyl protease family protein